MTARQPVISGCTRLLGIVGDPVALVKSPQSWNPRLAAMNTDAVLVPLHLRAADFDAAIDGLLRLANLDGLIVTMPFKERLLPHLTSVSRRAQQVGAVNAARRDASGAWVGDMFDGVGLVGAAREIGLDLSGLRVGLIGAGGAGSAIAFALAQSGTARFNISDADPERAQRLAARLVAEGSDAAAGPITLAEVDLLVNATPVGMADGDEPPIEVEGLTPDIAVIDIVTRPQTALLQEAAARGCRHAGGAAMVAAQTDAIMDYFGLRSLPSA